MPILDQLLRVEDLVTLTEHQGAILEKVIYKEIIGNAQTMKSLQTAVSQAVHGMGARKE